MSKNRNTDRICILVLILTLLVTILFMNGTKLGLQVIEDQDAESYTGTTYFTNNDLDGDWNAESGTTVTAITLDGDTASVSGSGAYVLDGSVYIIQSGFYEISGSLEDGSIIVDAADYSKVWIRLNGVDIYREDDACIRVDQADKVFLTLAEVSTNTLTSGSAYSEEALADGTDGVIYAHDDLTINGSGSLTVTAACGHGISVNDELVITGGTIDVTGAEDAIHTNDGFCLTGASLTLYAGDDGITTDGHVYIESGTLLIAESAEGIEGQTIDIAGGEVTICSSDDGINARDSSESGDMFGGMGRGGEVSADENVEAEASAENTDADDSADDAESDIYIRISGGSLTILCQNGRDADGLDSNGDVYITGGTVLISLNGDGSNCAIDVGSESGGAAYISGGTVIACGGSSMAESFSEDSEQLSVMYTVSATAAGDTASLTDAEGNTLLTWDVPNSFTSVVFSSPDLATGETYTLAAGEQTSEVTLETVSTRVGTSDAGMASMGIPQGDFPQGGFSRDESGQEELSEGGFPQGGFHRGGRRGAGTQDDAAETPEDPEESLEGGAVPEGPPEFEDGEMPEGMPSTDGEEAPSFGGSRPDAVTEETLNTEAVETASAADPAQIALLTGVSAIILLAGIVIAGKYRSFSV